MNDPKPWCYTTNPVKGCSIKKIILCITEHNPISDVLFDYCDIDTRCDECGTVTKPLGYKYDVFLANGYKRSSFSPTIAPTINKIFGGRRVKIGEVPWHVNLLYPTNYTDYPVVRIGSQNYYSFCGGTIVSNTKVISAAHCFTEWTIEEGFKWSSIKVIAGHSRRVCEDNIGGHTLEYTHWFRSNHIRV